ncbi:hypothetical protein P879_04432 [Paragonimus westermani]|uniref:Aquaporin-9 n=1 Tax=Paragonimus westermani TaxID=34504 RepID=A0A8T0DL00_9TREM|nr:hypothetical protein P879_04432 [Paragonimus westermani]
MSLVSVEYEREGCQGKYEDTLHAWADRMRLTKFPLIRACIGEFLGTIVLIYFGDGVIAWHYFSSTKDAVSISLAWGLAVLLGLFISGTMGYGLMNPAITLAFAVAGKVPWLPVPLLILCQIAGCYIGALLVYTVYRENIVKSAAWTMLGTGSIFVTAPTQGNIAGFIDQIIGTAMLTALCSAIGDKHNFNVPRYLGIFYVALLVVALVAAFPTHAGAALNPARDFGPRLAALSLGYKDAFSVHNYYFWVPIVGPILGALIGACLYELFNGIHLRGLAEEDARKKGYEEEDI